MSSSLRKQEILLIKFLPIHIKYAPYYDRILYIPKSLQYNTHAPIQNISFFTVNTYKTIYLQNLC